MTNEERIEKLARAFEEFKDTNDQRIKEIESKGVADPIHEEKLGKINETITELQGQIKSEKKRADDLEVRVGRSDVQAGARGAMDPKTEQYARRWLSVVQKKPESEVSVDPAAWSEYRTKQAAYLRYGENADHKGIFRNDMSVDSDPDGGFLVTPDLSGRVAELQHERSNLRAIANVQTISTDALEGANRLTQATAGGWVSERAARPATETPTLGQWRIPVHEQYAMPEVTQKLLDDAMIDVESLVSEEIAEILAFTEEDAFFSGTGVGQPRGFLTYGHGTPSATSWDVIERIPTGAAGAFDTGDSPPIGGDALVDTVFALKSRYRQGARWLMTRSTEGEARKLKDGQGNYLWQPNFTELGQATLLGFPVTESPDMPEIAANSLSIAFGNFAEGYQIVDRFGIRVLRDPYTNKPFVRFYTTKRVGGDVVNFEAIKLVRFATAAE